MGREPQAQHRLDPAPDDGAPAPRTRRIECPRDEACLRQAVCGPGSERHGGRALGRRLRVPPGPGRPHPSWLWPPRLRPRLEVRDRGAFANGGLADVGVHRARGQLCCAACARAAHEEQRGTGHLAGPSVYRVGRADYSAENPLAPGGRARQLVADLALDDLAQRGVLGGKLLERLDERAVAALELLHASGDDVHQDIEIVDRLEGFLDVIVSHAGSFYGWHRRNTTHIGIWYLEHSQPLRLPSG